ncbi:ATP-binding cassette domain-containing protein [Pseudoflavonifractor sp. An85]|uniref:ATP-binding cassette domain-containing protein n=1 Tax=Pseudoflavonifractor sp. An85 TaxID=1965661 RepID=UPI000B368070|nr:ATP-binding cassette domain-containing protein [Pseudoflavonifractor sp. An85]OUN22207.1 multidrug ABC transporter ATP-binding protein [Pseudoflavonifractor sp. An85]
MKLNLEHVNKTIKKALVLDDVTMTLEGGHIYGLKGPNGSGKTMLMRVMAGLIRPTSGRVCVDGRQLGRDMDFPPSVGLLLENPSFLPNHTGLKNLELLAGIQHRVTSVNIRQTLQDVGLNPDDPRTFRKYSLGMKQRLGIAAAIMEQPDLILVDEPTNALDDNGIQQICTLLRRERDRGALLILSCHDASILEDLSDEIFHIYDGKVERRTIS